MAKQNTPHKGSAASRYITDTEGKKIDEIRYK